MEAFFFVLLASFVDPIRWVICFLPAWLIPNYLGALAVGVGATVALSVMLGSPSSTPFLLGSNIASAVIVSVFYFWRQSRRNKKSQAST